MKRACKAVGSWRSSLIAYQLLLSFFSVAAQSPNFQASVAAFIEGTPRNSPSSSILLNLKSTFPNVYYLPATNQTLHAFQAEQDTTKSNRVSFAFATNQSTGVILIRSDTYISHLGVLQSSAPVIVVCYSNTVSTFYTSTVPEFTQSGSHFFHGFVLRDTPIPSLVLSVGPCGSGNYMGFYRFDFIPERDGSVKLSHTLLAEAAHVVDFSVNLDRDRLTIQYYTDKWDPNTLTNDAVAIH